MRLPRIAILCDFGEENWPSMDLVGEMLAEEFQKNHQDSLEVSRLLPPMRRRFTGRSISSGKFFNADRLMNRFWDYPRWLGKRKNDFDLFHIVDHSYSQLVHELPPDRAIVTCHDLDTFRCLLYPREEHRSLLFKAMTQHILKGFSKAARVTCDSSAVRDEIILLGLLPPERLVVIPNGVHPAYSPESNPFADREAKRLLESSEPAPTFLLHVGSTIPRKRIDLVLQIVGELQKELPPMRLIRIGGAFQSAQAKLLERLELNGKVTSLPFLKPEVLASIYRQAALVLLPSEREGFGLPVIEALACGTPVVASDLPVLREVGGDAATYCPVGDVPTWTEAIVKLIREKSEDPERWAERRERGIQWASRFSWEAFARKTAAVYQEILGE